MYRHSAAFNLTPKANGFLPLPTQEDYSASESESETIAELDRKRRQLDEEIAQFKTQKDKEFRDFEQDLRQKRKRKRSPLNGDNHIAQTPPTDPSVLSLLGRRPQVNGHAQKENQQSGLTPNTPPPSRPTLSIEKLTIVGTTVPPTTAEISPNILARSLTGTTIPPHIQSERLSSLPPTSSTQNNIKHEPPPTPIARDHNDPFAGVFTPSYLPLLDSRSSSSNSIAQEKPVEQPQLNSTSQPLPPASASSSLPSSPISPRNPSSQKRSYTAPLIPSTNSSSLTSALRVVSADAPNTRRRKHVTFRLADSVVVEPSSSYEEMSSPDLPPPSEVSNGKAKPNGIDEVLNKEEVPWSWSKGLTSPVVQKSDRMGMSLAGDGEGDEASVSGSGLYISNVSSNTVETSGNDPTATSAPSGLQFEGAEDGGSGVGFFELEEELDGASPGISPRLRSPRNDRARFFDDWRALPDGDEEEAEMNEQDQTGEQEELAKEMEYEEPQGLGISTGAEEKQKGSTFTSGSVPIDIVVRPSSSWVGSLGAGSVRDSKYVP